jgi:hypothetical protein
MKKFALFLLTAILVAVSLGVSAQTAQAEEGRTCYIGREGFVFSASECANYVIATAWVTTTYGHANVFLNAIENTITVTGQGYYLAYNEQEAAQFWGVPFSFDPAYIGWDCGMPQIWAVRWLVPIPTSLAPGEYLIHETWNFRHPLTDGYQACSQGDPIGRNIYSGYSEEDTTFTITP